MLLLSALLARLCDANDRLEEKVIRHKKLNYKIRYRIRLFFYILFAELLDDVTRHEIVQPDLDLVQISERKVESDRRERRQNGHRSVVPHEQRISRQRNESESDRGGEGGLEEIDLGTKNSS